MTMFNIQYSNCGFSLVSYVLQLDVSKLDQMEKGIWEMVCLLEENFPSFFDIMIHLTVHLFHKVRLCDLVYLRWMYPFERNMKTFKGYVHNCNHAEGSIAESFIIKETLKFCTEYLSNMPTNGNPPRHKENSLVQRPMSGGKTMPVKQKLLT